MRTIIVGSKATNQSLAFTYEAALKTGNHSWRVVATDDAGNKAIDMLSARLTVK